MENWVNNTFEKVDAKLKRVCMENREKIPYMTLEDGSYDDMSKDRAYWWTNGFWPGLMWLMYLDTKNEEYKKTAIRAEELLDKAFLHFDNLHHDVGFIWLLSSGVNYKLFGNEESKRRIMYAASILSSRYNLSGEFIRSWNGDKTGWAIIDCMMNIPILHLASEITDDPRFKYVAIKHADKTMNHHVRPDGSVEHVVDYDIETGEVVETLKGQGYDEGSSWARGQAWALYGFILSYIHTGKKEYLDTAKRIAHYFIAAVCDDYVPRCDFRSPDEPVYYDTSAGAIAACGLLEIAKAVPEHEKKVYSRAALNILKALDKDHCDYSDKTDSIVKDGTVAYHYAEKNIPLIYADYYFVEALYKLRGNELLFC